MKKLEIKRTMCAKVCCPFIRPVWGDGAAAGRDVAGEAGPRQAQAWGLIEELSLYPLGHSHQIDLEKQHFQIYSLDRSLE